MSKHTETLKQLSLVKESLEAIGLTNFESALWRDAIRIAEDKLLPGTATPIDLPTPPVQPYDPPCPLEVHLYPFVLKVSAGKEDGPDLVYTGERTLRLSPGERATLRNAFSCGDLYIHRVARKVVTGP